MYYTFNTQVAHFLVYVTPYKLYAHFEQCNIIIAGISLWSSLDIPKFKVLFKLILGKMVIFKVKTRDCITIFLNWQVPNNNNKKIKK